MALTKYYYSLGADSIFSYDMKPTDGSSLKTFATKYGSTFLRSHYLYDVLEDTLYNASADVGYAGFLNESGSAIEIYLIARDNQTGYSGPHVFRAGSRTSIAPEISGSYIGAWKIGTIYKTDRATSKQFDSFQVVAGIRRLRQEYYAGDQVTVNTNEYTQLSENVNNFTGCLWPGCVDASIAVTLPSSTSLTLGSSSISATGNITNSNWITSQNLYVRADNINIISSNGDSSLSQTITLPHSLEVLYPNATTSKSIEFVGRVTLQWSGLSSSQLIPPMFVNGDCVTNVGVTQYNSIYKDTTSVSKTVAVSMTRTPTISASGTKTDGHKSVYVLLPNNIDKLSISATVTDQSYGYQNVLTPPTFAFYVGDYNTGNYSPESSNSGTYSYQFDYGPFVTIPPLTEGTDYNIRCRVVDRFGRSAQTIVNPKRGSTSLTFVRFYNYITPTWTITGQRVNSSGTPDDTAGTNIKITYNWSLSQLDYAKSTHTGTAIPTLKVTNNQDTRTQSYNLSTAIGTNTFTLTSCAIDKSFTFTATLTDACGNSYEANVFVASGSVFMDFKAGGKGLGIGQRAEKDSTLQVAWNTEMAGTLQLSGKLTGSSMSMTSETVGTSNITTLNVTNSINGSIAANKATYNKNNADLSATDVQNAIDELANKLSSFSGAPGMQTGVSFGLQGSDIWDWVYYPDPDQDTLAWMNIMKAAPVTIDLSTLRSSPVTVQLYLPTYFFTYDGGEGNFPYILNATRADMATTSSQQCPLEYSLTPQIGTISGSVKGFNRITLYVWTAGLSTYSGSSQLMITAQGMGATSFL